MALTTFPKDPNATLDYSIDWSSWLAAGESLTSSTWTRSSTTLQESNTTLTTSIATIWLAGGSAGTKYTVANKIGTTSGRVDERTIDIKVLQRQPLSNKKTFYSKAPFALKGEVISHAPVVWDQFGPERGRKTRMHRWTSTKEEILAWKGIHLGETCCLIANGPSVNTLDLSKINCPTFGLNMAWKLGDWTYYCLADAQQVAEYQKLRGPISELKPLFSTHAGPESALRIRGLLSPVKKFSFDLTEGMYLNNTITCSALQVAVWMGFKKIYIVGLDLSGDHFSSGTKQQKECKCRETHFSNHRETFGYIAGLLTGMKSGIEIINLNPKSICFAFPKMKFEDVFHQSSAPHILTHLVCNLPAPPVAPEAVLLYNKT